VSFALPASISALSIAAALSGMRSSKFSPALTRVRMSEALAKEFTASPLSVTHSLAPDGERSELGFERIYREYIFNSECIVRRREHRCDAGIELFHGALPPRYSERR